MLNRCLNVGASPLLRTYGPSFEALLKEVPDRISNTIVQRYITNPLLINGLKFDLRIYLLVTSVDPIKLYIYEDGLVRFATEEFSLSEEHLKDKFRHLTNYRSLGK